MNDSILGPDEVIVWESSTHPKVLFVTGVIQLILLPIWAFLIIFISSVAKNDPSHTFPAGITLLVVALILIVELAVVGIPVLRWWTSRYVITNKVVRSRTGILTRKIDEIHIARVSQISIEAGLIDRVFGCGTLKLYDASNTLGLTFKDVPKVYDAKRIVDELREHVR